MREANNLSHLSTVPTEFQVFTYTASSGVTFPQWLKARDNEGWELITVINCASSPTWTNIQCAFKKKT